MMKMNLAACTLATALLATTAMAQTSPAPSTQAPAAAPTTAAPTVAPPAAGTVNNNATMNSTSAAASGQFFTVMSPNQWRASKFVGVDIYGANNEKIGDVNDIIVDNQGNINAVVIGVGGFLGIGEKDVAIPFRTVEWMMTDRNARSASSGAMGTNNAPAATNNGAMGTNSTVANNTAANRPANSTDVTGTTVSGSMDNRAYPDHGVLRMTKQDLQNAPSFHYADSTAARDNKAPQNPVPAGTKP
jgi:sporulation protein YlmC with PRC-barrel domain